MIYWIESISLGLIFALLAIGVMLTYKILDFADLSVDGTAPLGGVVCAMIMTHIGMPYVGLLGAFVMGCIAGAITGILHVKFHISGLLSGIMVMSGLYTVNLLVGTSKSNIPLANQTTIFTNDWLLEGMRDHTSYFLFDALYRFAIILLILVVIKVALDLFLKTKFGYLVKITGDNPELVDALGESVGKVKITTIALSNGCAALFGAVYVQFMGYYDINMGVGVIAAGLASVILGTTLIRSRKLNMTTMVCLGAVLYRIVISLSFKLDLPSSSEKLITVLVLFLSLLVHHVLQKRRGA